MKICLLNITNKSKPGSMDKDLAGGLGTYSFLGNSLFARFLAIMKKQLIKIPLLAFANLQAILKNKGHEVGYLDGESVSKQYDLVVVNGSIIDYHNEVLVCQKIKNQYPQTKVIVFGSFPSARPDLFDTADSVIVGDELYFFLNEFTGLENLPKIIRAQGKVNLNDLTTPDYTGFPINKFSYSPALVQKPFVTLQASQGCPYSCGYYCPYGTFQGPQFRPRSPEKLVEDIKTLVAKYKIKAVQFRDPVFGLNRADLEKFCVLMIKEKLGVKFGMETRLDIMDKGIINLMFAAGLRNINIGVETRNSNVAFLNKRKLIPENHQEEIIDYCGKIGVKISAFYILGLQGDTVESIKNTIEYAIKLNTQMVRFSVSTPYPGTKFYEELKAKNLILEDDYEKYDTSGLVWKHENLSPEQMSKLQNMAHEKFYLRFGYLINFIKWRIREFWL